MNDIEPTAAMVAFYERRTREHIDRVRRCLAMLAAQAYASVDVGLLSSWRIGGGIGLLTVGAASWYD